MAAGGVASLASSSYTSKELARQIRQGGASVVIVSEDLLGPARSAVSEIGVLPETGKRVTVLVLSSFPAWSLRVDGEGEEGELKGTEPDERLTWERITDPGELVKSLITLLYSSGTTGEPKGRFASFDPVYSLFLCVDSQIRGDAVARQLRSTTQHHVWPCPEVPSRHSSSRR
jgi:4-coumarate--CoA ligase